LDAEVGWVDGHGARLHAPLGAAAAAAAAATGVVPDPNFTVLLSNLPIGVTEEDLWTALAPCGPLSHVELCSEWCDWAKMADPRRKTNQEAANNPSDYSLFYALVTFKSEDGHRRALRRACRTFGIAVRMVSTVKSKKPAVRPVYPQDVRMKRNLLVRDIPWRLTPAEVLMECARALTPMPTSTATGGETTLGAGMESGWDWLRLQIVSEAGKGNISCRLRALNCGAFSGPHGSGLLRALEVEACNDGGHIVRQDPAATEAGGSSCGSISGSNSGNAGIHGNGGAAILRFPRFEDAYWARQVLSRCGVGAPMQNVFCGFPPWRPLLQDRDTFGHELCPPVLVDLPVRGASAVYNVGQADAVRRFGVPVVE